MAMLGKTICYINSSCIALMRWVKTLEHKIKKKDQERLLYYLLFTKKNKNLLTLCSKMILSYEGRQRTLASESERKLTQKLKSAMSREFTEVELKKKSNFCSCVLILENGRKINHKAQKQSHEN